MKYYIAALLLCVSFVPSLVHAEVVTSAYVQSLKDEMLHPSDAVKQSVAAQYGSTANVVDILFQSAVKMDSMPEWKTVHSNLGITFQVPWSPVWYLLGKQIPYYDRPPNPEIVPTEDLYYAGRYVNKDLFGEFSRNQYQIYIKKEDPRANHAYDAYNKNDDQYVTHFTLNGHRALLYYMECVNDQGVKIGGKYCDFNRRKLLVEIIKGEATYVVEVDTSVTGMDQDALRIAQSIK